MSALMDLAARCEAAEGPSRELDGDIAVALDWGGLAGPAWKRTHPWRWQDRGEPMNAVLAPTFTASLDAALTLVPEGWWVQHLGQRGHAWGCRLETQGRTVPNDTRPLTHSTPALALCAAALRARAAGEG